MPRLSLQTRFQLAILMVLGIVVLAMLLLWQRQQDSHHQVIDVTRQAMHGLLSEQVRVDGEAQVRQLSDSLANPLYYFDLDAIGTRADQRSAHAALPHIGVGMDRATGGETGENDDGNLAGPDFDGWIHGTGLGGLWFAVGSGGRFTGRGIHWHFPKRRPHPC